MKAEIFLFDEQNPFPWEYKPSYFTVFLARKNISPQPPSDSPSEKIFYMDIVYARGNWDAVYQTLMNHYTDKLIMRWQVRTHILKKELPLLQEHVFRLAKTTFLQFRNPNSRIIPYLHRWELDVSNSRFLRLPAKREI